MSTSTDGGASGSPKRMRHTMARRSYKFRKRVTAEREPAISSQGSGAKDLKGNASGPPLARAHPGETILPGVGGTQPDDVTKAFNSSVRELEARVAAADGEADRLAERLRECNARRNGLSQLVEGIRTWAAEQTPPIALPGDDGHLVPPPGLPGPRSVHIAGPPPGTHDFLGRPA